MLDYLLISVDTSVSITSSPAFSFTLGSAPPAGSAYLAELDLNNPTAGWSVFLGPGNVSGNTISFSSQTLVPPLTLKAKDTYVFALIVSSSTITPPPPTIAPNTSASFTGSKSVNYTYGFAFDYPAPGPTATAPPTTLNYNVTETVNVGASPFPTTAPSAQLTDEHVSETDEGSLATQTFTTDSWIALEASGSVYNELLYGQTQQQPTSSNLPVTTTLYGSPQILDKLPEANGSWTNAPTANVSYAYANGDSGVRAIASDGTYLDTEQIGPSSGGGQAVITENGDGSGSIVAPFYGGGFIDSITASAPSPAPSPMVNITFNYSSFAQTYYGYPAQQVIPDPVWYPYTAGTPPTFYSETDAATTGVTLPSGCMPNPYGAATDVRRTITMLDTMIGFIETTQFDSYNVNGFPVCMTTNDVLNYAYDLQGNTPYTMLIGQLGLQVVTTNETLVIQNTPASSSATAAAARAAQAGSMRAAVVALQAHELSSFAAQRARRTNAFMHVLRSGQNPRAVLIRGGHK